MLSVAYYGVLRLPARLFLIDSTSLAFCICMASSPRRPGTCVEDDAIDGEEEETAPPGRLEEAIIEGRTVIGPAPKLEC